MKITSLVATNSNQTNSDCSEAKTCVMVACGKELKPLSRSSTASECSDILEWNNDKLKTMREKKSAVSQMNNLTKLFVPFFVVHKSHLGGHDGSPKAKYSPRASRYSQSPWAPGGHISHPSGYLFSKKISGHATTSSVIQDTNNISIERIMATLSSSVTQVNMTTYLHNKQDNEACELMANSLKKYGAVLVRDPRVQPSDADTFINMMERYFSQDRSKKMLDARPELFYQIGATPDGIERPRDNSAIAATLQPSERPLSDTKVRHKDPKWRFFWRCGARPSTTDFPELNAEQVVPAGFASEWALTMDGWGHKLLNAVFLAAEMIALGLDLPRYALQEKMKFGPHLLAPTGADLSHHAENIGTTVAGYHYDINMLTIHGRSRYPGLYVWTRGGKRIPVVVPHGYLLIQSGIQLEYLTAGCILRGMHEVVISEETAKAAKSARENGASLWRVSSTLFAHVRSDELLTPLGHFAASPDAHIYGNKRAGEQIAEELRALELAT